MAERIRLTDEELKYAQLFHMATGIEPVDVVVDESFNRIIFVVDRGMAPIAVGRNGTNIKLLKQYIKNMDIEVIERGDSPEELIQNSLYPARVLNVKVVKDSDGKLVAYVTVAPEDKAIAIGRGGKNINRARLLARRYFNIAKVVLL